MIEEFSYRIIFYNLKFILFRCSTPKHKSNSAQLKFHFKNTNTISNSVNFKAY